MIYWGTVRDHRIFGPYSYRGDKRHCHGNGVRVVHREQLRMLHIRLVRAVVAVKTKEYSGNYLHFQREY